MAICSKEHYRGCGDTAFVQMTDCTHRECRDYRFQHISLQRYQEAKITEMHHLELLAARQSIRLTELVSVGLTGFLLLGMSSMDFFSRRNQPARSNADRNWQSTAKQQRPLSNHKPSIRPSCARLPCPVMDDQATRVPANNCNVYNGGGIMFRSCLPFLPSLVALYRPVIPIPYMPFTLSLVFV